MDAKLLDNPVRMEETAQVISWILREGPITLAHVLMGFLGRTVPVSVQNLYVGIKLTTLFSRINREYTYLYKSQHGDKFIVTVVYLQILCTSI